MKTNLSTNNLEALFEKTRTSIEIPSRAHIQPIFESVTKYHDARYIQQGEMNFFQKIMHRMKHARTALFVSTFTSIALILLVVVPYTGTPSPSPETIADEWVQREGDQEVLLLNQEDVLIDQVIENYFDHVATLSSSNG